MVAVTIHSDQIIFDYLQESGLIMVSSTELLLANTLLSTSSYEVSMIITSLETGT